MGGSHRVSVTEVLNPVTTRLVEHGDNIHKYIFTEWCQSSLLGAMSIQALWQACRQNWGFDWLPDLCEVTKSSGWLFIYTFIVQISVSDNKP